MIIVYINCSMFPFIDWIISGLKLYETRSRNMLRGLVGKTVYLAQTGKGKQPVVRCCCTISEYLEISSKKDYNALRKYTRVKHGSLYDWSSSTKRKYLYKLDNVTPVDPFQIPEGGIRHGRTYIEFI